MEKRESRLKAIIYLRWLTFEKLCVSFFWFGIFYFICIIIYRTLKPLFQLLCQLFSALPELFCFPLLFIIKGIAEVVDFLCGVEFNIILSLVSIAIGGLLKTYLMRQEERKLGEIEFLPATEALEKFREYYVQAEKEGWDYKLIDIARKRKDEFLEAALESKNIKGLEKIIGEEKYLRYEFLKSYYEKDWQNLRTNLPKWLEELGKEERWRKAIYDAAAECYDATEKAAARFTIKDLWDEWFKSGSGRKLLREPRIWEKLPKDKQQRLGPGIEIPWPKDKKRPEQPNILRWCEAVGLKFNPFGPEYAEEDPSLSQYYVFPEFWSRFLQPSPALVLGPEGSGKSALGLYLAHHLRENYKTLQDKTLAIFMAIIELNPDALPLSIGENLALRTLELVAHNPFGFIEAPSSHKGPLARLWLYFVPNIRAELAASGLKYELLSSIAEEVEKLGSVTRTSQISLSMLVELLLPLIPLLGEFQPIYLVADLKALPPDNHDLALWLKRWVYLTPSLLMVGFYPKILCVNPLSIAPQDFARIVGWEWDVFVLDWDEEKLVNIVEQRIKAASIEKVDRSSFDALRKPPLAGVTKAIAQAAKGSPRKLIRLGNEILQRAAEHLDDPYITDEDLRGILP